jgi:hypothetical protein
MDQQKRRLRVILSIIGLACIVASIAMIFLAPGTFWNWGLLLVALVFVFLARRAA